MYRKMIGENFSIEEAALVREESYSKLAQGEKDIILDFANCEFIDSTGLGVLVGLYKKCQERDASMILENITERVYKVFKMTRLDNVFDIL